MSLNLKFFRLGFVIYLFSFFLPAAVVYDTPYYGYMSAYISFGLLFDPIEVVDHYLIVAANLANLSTVLVFLLHFKLSLDKLLPLQLLAFVCAAMLAVAGLFQEESLGPMLIGFWNWLFGILIMLVVMICALRSKMSEIPTSKIDGTSPK